MGKIPHCDICKQRYDLRLVDGQDRRVCMDCVVRIVDREPWRAK